jgi:hypothetical protein
MSYNVKKGFQLLFVIMKVEKYRKENRRWNGDALTSRFGFYPINFIQNKLV